MADVELQPELEITIYRIITEAMTNVTRHAQADHISVQMQVEKHHVILNIEDDGLGFDAAAWFSSPAERQSLGLAGMRERAGLLGGQLEVISESGHGTKIWAQLPIGGSYNSRRSNTDD
ncbi:sensor histidine kinase [Chloroflexota bacterium]